MNISHKKFFVDTVKIVARRKILTSWKNGKFLTKQAYQNWPRKKKKFNGLQFVKESEPEIKALLRKTPHPKTSLVNSTEHLIRNENMMSTIHHTFQKTEEEEHLSVVSWGSYDPDTTAWERHYRKGIVDQHASWAQGQTSPTKHQQKQQSTKTVTCRDQVRGSLGVQGQNKMVPCYSRGAGSVWNDFM